MHFAAAMVFATIFSGLSASVDVNPSPDGPGVTIEGNETAPGPRTGGSSGGSGSSVAVVDPNALVQGCGVLGFLTDSCGQPPNTPEASLPDEILHAIETIGLPATTLYLQPDTGTTLINIPTIYYTHATV
ncbi:MAG: hypothetical protein QM597_00380, partial [Aeromicrobium sp.]|uniref:hypothetical protein n=1 Tax=Aeromicrobium sp. TaxID=1871063 RepID=UPI0039E4CC00